MPNSPVLLRHKTYEQELMGRAYYRQSNSCVVAIMPSLDLIKLSAVSALAKLVWMMAGSAQAAGITPCPWGKRQGQRGPNQSSVWRQYSVR